jgi:O-antigen/teichoic acid export membrane protein
MARALGPQDRGYLALLTLVSAIAWNLGPLGIPLALNYAVARVPTRALDLMCQLRRPAVVRGIAATAASAVVLLILTVDEPTYVQVGAGFAVLSVPGVIGQSYGLTALNGLRQFRAYNLLRVAPTAAFAVAAAILLVIDAGFIPFALAWGLSRMVFAPATLLTARRRACEAQTGDGSIPSISWLLRFGRRGFLGGGSVLETYRVDQAFVALFLPAIDLGLYVVALAFTSLPRFIAQSIGDVSAPNVARQQSRRLARRVMWRFFWIAIPIYLPVALALLVFAPELTEFFFGDEFTDAVAASQLLMVATVLYCARRVLAAGARSAGYPGLGSVAEVTGLASALALFAACVPAWGIEGASIALIGASALALLVLVVGLVSPASRRSSGGSSWFEPTTADPAQLDGT